MTGEHTLPRHYRLRKKAEFDRVLRRNAAAADHVLVVAASENELDHPRLGVVVSRKVGKAVVRNRWKRLIREAFRLCRAQLPAGVDLVVRPRRGAAPDFHAVRRSLPPLARRAARRLSRNRPTSDD